MSTLGIPITLIETRSPGRSGLASVLTIARRELRDSLPSRWLVLYTIAFAALGIGVSFVSAASGGGLGLAGFGRTSAGLINLVLLIVPLMALTAGAGTVASDRERGMLLYLLAQPLARWELLLGKYLGLALTLLTSICLGFGLCAVVLAWQQQTIQPAALAQLAGLAALLALAMLSLGMLVSVLARKTSVAIGTAVFLWLTFVFVSDLGLMAGALAMRLRIETLLGLAMLNPLQVFKMWSLGVMGASMDVLGPAGLYAQDTFADRLGWIFAAAMALWTILPLSLATLLFARRSPV